MYEIYISPPDYVQGDSVRIMYVHVPSSFISLGCFGFIGIASILNLIFKIKFVPLVIMFLGMVVYSLIIFLMRYKTELMKLKLDKKNQK